MLGKLVLVNLCRCGEVAAEELTRLRVFLDQHNASADIWKFIHYGFNLVKLHSEASQLDLIVKSAEELNLAVLVVACQIAAAIGFSAV